MPQPHGGTLIDLTLSGTELAEAMKRAAVLKRVEVSVELAQEARNIAYGVYSPLTGFMDSEELASVVERMRLPGDVPWTLPVLLDLDETQGVSEGEEVALCEDGEPFALMEVRQLFTFDRRACASRVFGTQDEAHPGVAALYAMKPLAAGGPLRLLRRKESEFSGYDLTPLETRVLFREKGWSRVVGFQTRNVPHLGHEYVQKTALTFADGLFVNPVIGKKKKGDFTDRVILDSCRALVDNYYLRERAVIAILSYQMRYAGPREAIFHAIVRKNFGCTHFIVGRDHAGVGDYYGPFEAQEIFGEFPDLGITPVFFNTFAFCTRCAGVVNEKTCPHSASERIDFSGTRIRKMLVCGEVPPPELMRPEVAQVILDADNPFVE